MPLFEFECRDCGHVFEVLVRGSISASCPRCHGPNLDRLLSTFAASSDATRQSNIASARQRHARTNRDKRIAEHEQAKRRHDHD
jgi:putative FmdB family regulatory protein